MLDQPTSTAPAVDQLQRWITDRVAYYLQLAPAEIDETVSLSRYGLDSVYALSLCGDLEDEFHVTVDPTLVWDVDTVAALSRHVADLLATAPS